MKKYLITGATSGLGYEITKQLIKSNNKVIMAVRNYKKGLEIAKSFGPNASVATLNLSSLENINNFITQWNEPIDGLINNAGVQNVYKTCYTDEGYEETIAVNHLASLMLTLGLKPYLTTGKILFIGSGTHNPHHPLSRFFGFKGAMITDLSNLINGKTDEESIPQANLNRYATSKLLNIISALELAGDTHKLNTYVLDPGLMPGTKLARGQNKIKKFLWNYVMPLFIKLLPDTSTPQQSAKAASWILNNGDVYFKPGSIISFNKKRYPYVWEEIVYNDEIRKKYFYDSITFINEYMN